MFKLPLHIGDAIMSLKFEIHLPLTLLLAEVASLALADAIHTFVRWCILPKGHSRR